MLGIPEAQRVLDVRTLEVWHVDEVEAVIANLVTDMAIPMPFSSIRIGRNAVSPIVGEIVLKRSIWCTHLTYRFDVHIWRTHLAYMKRAELCQDAVCCTAVCRDGRRDLYGHDH